MFKCPHCGLDSKTLVMSGLGYVGCPNCVGNTKRVSSNMHTKAGLHGAARNITELGKKNILDRKMGPDGQTCVRKSNPNKRWDW